MPPSSHSSGWTGLQDVSRSPPPPPLLSGEQVHEAAQKHDSESSTSSQPTQAPWQRAYPTKHSSHEDRSTCDIQCPSNSSTFQSSQSTFGSGLLNERTVNIHRRVPCYSPAAPHNLPRTPVVHPNVALQSSSSSGKLESQHNIFKRPTCSPRAGARLSAQRKITSPLGHRLPKK